MGVQAVFLLLPGRAKEFFPQRYWGGVGRILGLRLTVIGRPPRHRPILFVANHCSWLDIVALGSVLPGCFVAKGAIAHWPFINWIARLGRTVFVSRSRATVGREQNEILRRLAKGDHIILFPEGTTSDGSKILPLSSSFLALAEGPSKPYVVPVTIVYDQLNGLPLRKIDRPRIAWYGDMDLASHYNFLGRQRSFHATIVLSAAILPGTFGNRKTLTARLDRLLTQNAAALRQGRPVP